MSEEDIWTDVLGFTDLGTKERKQTIEDVKNLIEELPDRHPKIFEDEPVSPDDYRFELHEAIFSLGGKYRQGHGADSEQIVREQFLEPAREAGLLTFSDDSEAERIDFKGRLTDSGKTYAMDVKGGEGQSIGHLLVPMNTDILCLWSERNAKNTKSPASRLNEVINRTVRWGLNHNQDPTMMVIRDEPAGARTDDGHIIPDVIVFPQEFPTMDNPNPPMPSLDELPFAELIFSVLTGYSDLNADMVKKHIWWHELHHRKTEEGAKIDKEIYNAFDTGISLNTRPIDYERISDVT